MTSPKVSWMSLTAKKKMQMAKAAEVDFSGMDTQLTVYSRNATEQLNNIKVAESFITGLGTDGHPAVNGSAYIWENVPFEIIKKKFFDQGFKVPETSRAFQQIDLLSEWIEKQTEKGDMINWKVLACGVKVKGTEDPEKIWALPNGCRIGKINRSCKTDSGDRINIGVLSGKRDYVADITEKMVGSTTWNEMNSSKKLSKDYRDYRVKAGVDKVPLFLIYRIDKDSKPTRGDRSPLNVKNDLIGITMVIPGIRGTRGTVTRLKIRPIEDEQEVEG
jgi:hypothetical protein